MRKQRIVRIYSLLFAILLTAIFFNGCQGKKTQQGDKTRHEQKDETYKFKFELSLDRPDCYKLRIDNISYLYRNNDGDRTLQTIVGYLRDSKSISLPYSTHKVPVIIEYDVRKSFFELSCLVDVFVRSEFFGKEDELEPTVVSMKISVNDRLIHSTSIEYDDIQKKGHLELYYDVESNKYFIKEKHRRRDEYKIKEIEWVE